MRVFAIGDLSVAAGARPTMVLSEGTRVWGVPGSTALSAEEREEHEFDALTECVLVHVHESMAARRESEASQRVVCAAFDLDDSVLTRANSEFGEWAHEVSRDSRAVVKSWLVSEGTVQDLHASEFAPEMLWFDPAESGTALEFQRGSTL